MSAILQGALSTATLMDDQPISSKFRPNAFATSLHEPSASAINADCRWDTDGIFGNGRRDARQKPRPYDKHANAQTPNNVPA